MKGLYFWCLSSFRQNYKIPIERICIREQLRERTEHPKAETHALLLTLPNPELKCQTLPRSLKCQIQPRSPFIQTLTCVSFLYSSM